MAINPKQYFTADRGVFGCRLVETVGALYTVVSESSKQKQVRLGAGDQAQ